MNPEFSKPEQSTQDGFCILYICSAARSGSTLTDMFVGGHSQAASLGEINQLGKAISLDGKCSCGEKLRACMQWRKVFDVILSTHGIDLIKNPYAFRLWDAEDKRAFDYIRDKICNGLYAEYVRYDRWSDVHMGLIVWLEWGQIYGEMANGKSGNPLG